MLMLRALMVISCFVGYASVYNSGAPSDACENMLPQHPHAPQIFQKNSGIYNISVISDVNTKYYVTLKGGRSFKGFFIKFFDMYYDPIEGDVLDADQPVQSQCEDSAVTHANSDLKQNITFNFIPRQDYAPPLRIQATVVEDYSNFYRVDHLVH